jgi:glycosyltransferase involved in cell wall biosynthesis
MEIKKLVVTSDAFFLPRYKFLFETMSQYLESLECLPSGELYESQIQKTLMKIGYGINYLVSPTRASRLRKNARTFIARSRQTERKIRQLEYKPDFVFHFYSMYCPFWDKFDIPYALYLDYTMALSKRTWSPWSPFSNLKELTEWMDCERIAYERANHIFTMSSLVKTSLVEDYGIEAEKITVVGVSGPFLEPYEGEKTFGSKQLLFNGSDFKRKGGDLVLAAFRQVKQTIPEAKLVIIGKKLNVREDGVDNPGRISSPSEMRNLFLKTDLVLAPARCDPFPLFVIEAMNYGIPCIVSNIDGMPEIVDNEVNGLVIAQLTPDILANQIVNLLRDRNTSKSMSEKARHKVKTKLNWNHVSKNIWQVLST